MILRIALALFAVVSPSAVGVGVCPESQALDVDDEHGFPGAVGPGLKSNDNVLDSGFLQTRVGDFDYEPTLQEWLDITNRRPLWAESPAWADSGPPIHARERRASRQRVAVLCSGTLKRFFLMETVIGLIEPMVKQGHEVDYYLSLNMAHFKSFRREANRFVPEQDMVRAAPAVSRMIADRIKEVGGFARHVELTGRMPLDSNATEFLKNAWLKAGENVLKKLKPLEDLWQITKDVEGRLGAYTIVIMLDDDTIWLKPFDLDRLLHSSHHTPLQALNLDCGPNSTKRALKGKEYTEYIWILNRSVADPFGMQYSHLLSGGHQRTLNLEQFSFNLAKANNISMESFPIGLIPMQRGGRLKKKDGNVTVCLHKCCNDKNAAGVPLLNPKEWYPMCWPCGRRC